jgi:2OG-Fe(II) oxygenase superfamily
MTNETKITKSEIAPGIMLFENVFPNSMDYIEKIEEENLNWHQAKVLENQKDGNVNHKARDTDIIILPYYGTDQTGILADFSKDFYSNMLPCLDEYIDNYHAKISTFEDPQLLRYGKEQMFDRHIDDHPLNTRRVSMTYYMNDDYEGGDVSFNRFDLRFKAKKNNLLIFPSNFVYSHEVHPVTDGLRYVVVQWMA